MGGRTFSILVLAVAGMALLGSVTGQETSSAGRSLLQITTPNCTIFNTTLCQQPGSPGPNCCFGSCVNLSTDSNNCGFCGVNCTRAGLICCRGRCVDLRNDVRNCGACGIVCPSFNSQVLPPPFPPVPLPFPIPFPPTCVCGNCSRG